jgi:hypothetical protein
MLIGDQEPTAFGVTYGIFCSLFGYKGHVLWLRGFPHPGEAPFEKSRHEFRRGYVEEAISKK